jgi:hypothetical protein
MNPTDDIQRRRAEDLAPPDVYDPVIAAYMKDVDRTLLRENLKLTPDERMCKFERNMQMLYELRRAGRKRREQSQGDP